MIPEVSTPRLLLRAFADDDLDDWAAIVADPEVQRYTGGVMSRIEAWLRMAAYHGHWVLSGYGQWAVVDRATSRVVGRAGLWFPPGWPELEVGWTLAREVWGRGYATEAGRAAVAWGRAEVGLTRVASVIDPQNARSIAVAERPGMTFDRRADLGRQPISVYAMSL